MIKLDELHTGTGHEQVVECRDSDCGYHGIVAIHSTRLGTAVGGTRFWNYASFVDALTDVLRLSRGMSYKCAAAGLDVGGGKSVIIGDSRSSNRDALLRAHGRFIDHFAGRYITAEDVGTSPDDMEVIRQETPHVGGRLSTSGDPSPHTARGVFRALQAAARFHWGTDELAGRTIALQGCGNVGYHLARELHEAGASLILTDVDSERAQRAAQEFGGRLVAPEEIYDVEADIFAPCALGGILNDQTLPRLRVAIIAGAANNQLLEDRHGELLQDRGIVYVPDYVANAGGVINGAGREISGWAVDRARRAVDGIYDTSLTVLELARAEDIPASLAADRIAETRLNG